VGKPHLVNGLNKLLNSWIMHSLYSVWLRMRPLSVLVPCVNYFKLKRHTIELHLCKYGFKEGYEIWTEHGESHVSHDDFFDQRKTTHRKINNQSTSGVSFVEPDPSLSPEDPSC